MNFDGKDVEASDAEKVDLALRAIKRNDFSVARRLLEEVILNAPEEYIYQYEESDQLFIKFWDEDEFLHYVMNRKDVENDKNIFWIKSAYPRAYFFLGFIDNEEGNDESAIAHLEASLKFEPDQPISYCEMATIYSRMKQHEKALSLYEQALQARSYIPSKIRARALRGKGIELIELGDLNLAKRCLIESLYFDPNNELAYEELFYIHLLLTGEPNVSTSPSPLQLKRSKTSDKIRCVSCGKELMSGLEDECKALNVKGKIVYICTSCAKNETYKEAISIKYRGN